MGEYVAHFDVVVSGIAGSNAEEWRRALRAPLSELPELSPEQEGVARRFGIAPQEYARSYLALEYARQRMVERGKRLGAIIASMSSGIAAGYRIRALVLEATKGRWVVQIETQRGMANIAIPRELADDVLDSGTIQDLDRLKSLLRSSLERSDLIGLQ